MKALRAPDDSGGRHEIRGRIDREPAEALAGLLGVAPPDRAAGTLPAGWHWVYLRERHRRDDLGPDGHPISGIPTPPGQGYRRMFAGGRCSLLAPLRFDRAATRSLSVVATSTKQGSSGELTFVTVREEIRQAGELSVVEEQDIVYRAPPRQMERSGGIDGADSGTTAGAAAAAADADEFRIDPVVLFEFSALTSNAHRIHYDLPYALREGYPDLVVHGPLLALLMSELMRGFVDSMIGREFSYRLHAPGFGEQILRVSRDAAAEMPAAQVHDERGRLLATSTLRPLG